MVNGNGTGGSGSEEAEELSPREKCIRSGGTWDAEKKVCRRKTDPKTFTAQKLDKEGNPIGDPETRLQPTQSAGVILSPEEQRELQKIRSERKIGKSGGTGGRTREQFVEQVTKPAEEIQAEVQAVRDSISDAKSAEAARGAGVLQRDITITNEFGEEQTIPAGSFIDAQQAANLGLTTKSPGQQQGEAFLQAGTIAASAASPAIVGGGTRLVGSISRLLGRAFSRGAARATTRGVARATTGGGSRALGTNPRALGTNPRAIAASSGGVLQAPNKVKGSLKGIGLTNAILLGGFLGIPSAKTLSSKVINRNVDRIEAEVSKLGEQLTKIPETHSLGFSIDENGELFEYDSTVALAEINEIERILLESERSLQTSGIGNTLLKLSGKLTTAQFEIDKQKRELAVARGKVLRNIANPSETLLNTRELFRMFDVEQEI